MSIADKSIKPRILESAKVEFIKSGYQNASLKTICENAGVTTGALYKRFSGKAELFEELLTPVVRQIFALSREHDKENREYAERGISIRRWEDAEKVQKQWMKFLYQHLEEIQLLLCRAEGTRYENFLEDFVNEHTKNTIEGIKHKKQLGIKVNDLERMELYIILKGYWTSFFEPARQGLSQSRANRIARKIAAVYNWNSIFGYETE